MNSCFYESEESLIMSQKLSDKLKFQLVETAKTMSEDYKLDNIAQELDLFLAASARKRNFICKPIVLKAEFKNIPAVSDDNKRVFEIDMTQLISFRDYFNDKQYKWVRLHDWQFNLKFDGKVCKSIELNCQHVALIASKTNKHEIKDCNFTLTISNEKAIEQLTGANQGYLNRLGKRNLVANSEYVAEEHFAIIQFVKKPLNFNAVEKICMPSAAQAPQEDPMTYLNARGKDLLEKLRNFISRQDLLNFMVDQQLSEAGEKQMRRIVLSDVLGSSKQKGGYERNIIEALHRNLVQ